MKPPKNEASFDAKPIIVEASVDMKPSIEVSVDMKPSLVGSGVSNLHDNEVDTAVLFFTENKWKVWYDMINWVCQ